MVNSLSVFWRAEVAESDELRGVNRLPILGLAQSQYIGFAYPAGGQQGTTFPIRLGGQGLVHASDVIVSGEGVSVRLVDYYRFMGNRGDHVLAQQLR